MADSQVRTQRPLSPHIQIFRPYLTMMMSITHRITGGALYVGTLLLVVWLLAAATGRSGYEHVQWFMGSIIGRLILLGYTWALIHHLIGGVRHLVWDVGLGFGPEARENMARLNIIGSVVLTILIWIVAYAVR
ncbi:succinate dehydrogenase, cytochrome b556 subunit [Alsobacter soli]|uniref:Succinate dehydrogenase cytochrome b556 subunit n=1 Tax=Alsobacter soli TaxID=2109933 RepID=A0A2T1HW12_9HYPH|nr:succinate dehydrogenase, cytochrome b556 subunit [Alsobacter soli]PSC05843.1 succinate dehydrogenase, cytochrome b556 subunit [Alsobacter soli]